MSLIGMPPGNILQLLYIRFRIKELQKEYGLNTFIELGSGNGDNSSVFLKEGLQGKGFDLNESACKNNKVLNANYIKSNKYEVFNSNFFEISEEKKIDALFSCMVIEHFPEDLLDKYFVKAKKIISKKGRIMTLVPSSMKYWGIEDEIAGHIRRFEFAYIEELAKKYGFEVVKSVGLTYPISNWLFSFSNKIVNKNEAEMLNKSQQEKTVYTGNREVKFKTTFPKIFDLILNPIIMFPFYLLQKLGAKSSNSMVIYFELKNIE
jgi:hypothetical protein